MQQKLLSVMFDLLVEGGGLSVANAVSNVFKAVRKIKRTLFEQTFGNKTLFC